MSRLYLLVKRNGAKSYQGAIPARKGMTKTKLQKALKGRVNSQYSVKIVTSPQLKNYIKRMAWATRRKATRKKSRKKATRKRRKTVKRKTTRKKKR